MWAWTVRGAGTPEATLEATPSGFGAISTDNTPAYQPVGKDPGNALVRWLGGQLRKLSQPPLLLDSQEAGKFMWELAAGTSRLS